MRISQLALLGFGALCGLSSGCSKKQPAQGTAPSAAAHAPSAALPSSSAARADADADPAPSAHAAATPSAEPDTVTQASPTHEAAGPAGHVATAALEAVDGAKLRERHIARLKSDRSAVTLLQGEDALTLGQRLCEAVVPARPPETPVLVKPNLCGFDGFKNTAKSGGDDGVQGRVTDVEFTRGVVRARKSVV
mgnify:CR=1 FL=1